ncbi:keratin, type I cytoskeletal 18-like [Nycticebus coucang]|uniref:keratin, type I cytoskeletal 18-like n=1 Tax=Nycticebus coucang TaxID=9470 RepID=UPI00234D0E09|nr:keratin, type I cytoskeletal 18-like [Nycticebus coucang]
MQELNDCLASYLDRVRNLETDNRRLDSKIREHLEKKGPQVRDWAHYFKIIEDLRAQIFANSVDNAHIILQIDNAHLAADDFRVKYETELAMHQSVESDIHGLHKVIDDTNITQLQLESEIEALKEELKSAWWWATKKAVAEGGGIFSSLQTASEGTRGTDVSENPTELPFDLSIMGQLTLKFHTRCALPSELLADLYPCLADRGCPRILLRPVPTNRVIAEVTHMTHMAACA